MATENPSDAFLDKNLQKNTHTFKCHFDAKYNTVGTRVAKSKLQEGKMKICACKSVYVACSKWKKYGNYKTNLKACNIKVF